MERIEHAASPVDNELRRKTLVVLDALLTGLRIKIGKTEYMLDGANNIAIVVTRFDDNGPIGEVLLGYHHFGSSDVSKVVDLARAMTDQEYEVISANLALNRI